MPDYRRAYVPGGTFFFTVVTAERACILCKPDALKSLRIAFDEACDRWPFTIEAIVILPDHLHTIWSLPDGDTDFSLRWAFLKKTFTKGWLADGGPERPVSHSKRRNRRRGVWQRRFWEHTIRDEEDFARHCDYIHYNPVRHSLVQCPHQWPHSSFQKWVDRRVYDPDWQCVCDNRVRKPLSFDAIAKTAME